MLSTLKHLLSDIHWHILEGGIMMIRLSVHLIMIHHHSFWEFGAYIDEVAKLVDKVGKDDQEMHLYKVEIRFVHKMLGNF